MKKLILFSATRTEKRAALLEDDTVVELVVERPDDIRMQGNIYRGKIKSILPGLQSAFIDIGLDKCAFLHASDVDPTLLLDKKDAVMERYSARGRTHVKKLPRIPIEKILSTGQEILVLVTKEPIGSKGAKVTTQISIAGRFLVLVPDSDFIGVSKKTSDYQKRRKLKQIISQLKPPGIGFIVRTIGLSVSEEEFIKEIHHLIDQWRQVQKEALAGEGPKRVYKEMGITTRVIRDLLSNDVSNVYVDQKDDFREIQQYIQAVSPNLSKRVVYYKERIPLFDRFDIEKDLERSLRRKVWLRSGGYIAFDHAEALLAIDVNTGRNIGRADFEETLFQTNMEAAHEIVRQLRLRDIGGLIVVDFIDMNRADNRKKLETEMRKLLRNDRTSTSSTGLSKFSLMEITRKRVRPELQELYTDVCPMCHGVGWVISPATVTSRIDRWLRRLEATKRRRRLSLTVHPSVAAFFNSEGKDIIKEMEKEHKVTLLINEDETLEHDEYIFKPIDSTNKQKR
ncbi:MAG: Rne/Rng family ribonuclease [Chitinivibrionales bacterium]|nr:Rne/Rng family ribonuclease [Chitinivibrionales bacterium]